METFRKPRPRSFDTEAASEPPMDQPGEAKRPNAPALARLAALGDSLRDAPGYQVKLDQARGLRLRLSIQPDTRDLITCRPRATDNNALWFFTSWQHPISRADDLDAARAEIARYLVVRL